MGDKKKYKSMDSGNAGLNMLIFHLSYLFKFCKQMANKSMKMLLYKQNPAKPQRKYDKSANVIILLG